MVDDSELLRRFVAQNADKAFSELVSRHVDLVYVAAMRQVGQDAHLAWDVSQSVFLLLARKAPSLLDRQALGGWLFTTTRFVAKRAVRTQQRWRARELEANAMHVLQDNSLETNWSRLAPILDDVLHELKEIDRNAIVLRFLENCSFAAVANRLGVSEEAARKRVDRALEKLRARLERRGIASTAAALGTALAAHATGVAPAGLAAAATGVSIAGLAGAGGAGLAAELAFMGFMSKTKIAAAVALLAALGYTAVEIHNSTERDFARIRDLESALKKSERREIAARTERDELLKRPVPVALQLPSLTVAPVEAAGTNVADLARLLREQGVRVKLRIFDGRPEINPKAKEYFQMSDAEAQKVQDAFAQARHALDDIAQSTSRVSGNDGKTLFINIPQGPGADVGKALSAEVVQILGSGRAIEFFEMGADEFALELWPGERNIEISREVSGVAPDGSPVYRISERIGNGLRMGYMNGTLSMGYTPWLSKYASDVADLIPSPPKPGEPNRLIAE